MLMRYHPATTRKLYVAIATRNRTLFLGLLDEIKSLDGIVGIIMDFKSISEKQRTPSLFCEREKILDETLAFETQSGSLETFVDSYPWDGSGVWLPGITADEIRGTPLSIIEEKMQRGDAVLAEGNRHE
jgi:hypothetical protein